MSRVSHRNVAADLHGPDLAREQPLEQAARDALRAAGYTELERLDCEVDRGVLVLRGVVSSYYAKQIAQVVLRRLEGIQQIQNQVEVEYPSDDGGELGRGDGS